jgi:predicted nucleotidyltransferase component of viral defense system
VKSSCRFSRRETPTLPTERHAQIEQSYFKLLLFPPAEITCLPLPEILAEELRACYQRNKARDIYDLGMFATGPLDQARIRHLVILKLWQARDTFDPARLMQKFERAGSSTGMTCATCCAVTRESTARKSAPIVSEVSGFSRT